MAFILGKNFAASDGNNDIHIIILEFSADEHGLNCGLDFRAQLCARVFHYISRDLIFIWYDNSDGGCGHVG